MKRYSVVIEFDYESDGTEEMITSDLTEIVTQWPGTLMIYVEVNETDS